MKIAVLIKQVPDSPADTGFADDFSTVRTGDLKLSELDEYAVEQALQIGDAAGGAEITFVTVGPESAHEALRKALSMGGDAGLHVSDEALHGTDALGTSLVLASALGTLEWDLVVTGMSSTDAWMGVVPALVAERLGVPALTLAGQVTVEGDTVTIQRDSDEASRTVTATMPCLVGVTDQTGEARYPSFKGIMAAKKKPIATLALADLGITTDKVGTPGAATSVLAADRRPPRSAGLIISDEGNGGELLAGFLATQKFI